MDIFDEFRLFGKLRCWNPHPATCRRVRMHRHVIGLECDQDSPREIRRQPGYTQNSKPAENELENLNILMYGLGVLKFMQIVDDMLIERSNEEV